MFHGIILNKEFVDPTFIDTFKIFNKRKSLDSDWILFGIEIEDEKLFDTINNIQENLVSGKPFYAHLYNNDRLIIIFKQKIFELIVDKSSWKNFINYGKTLGIPEKQLKVAPIRFKDEENYFNLKK